MSEKCVSEGDSVRAVSSIVEHIRCVADLVQNSDVLLLIKPQTDPGQMWTGGGLRLPVNKKLRAVSSLTLRTCHILDCAMRQSMSFDLHE